MAPQPRSIRLERAVLSGGVFQNRLLLVDLAGSAAGSGIEVWTHRKVPLNDGGTSLGQAALAVAGPRAPAPGDPASEG